MDGSLEWNGLLDLFTHYVNVVVNTPPLTCYSALSFHSLCYVVVNTPALTCYSALSFHSLCYIVVNTPPLTCNLVLYLFTHYVMLL